MGWKKLIFGEKMPDKDDPKYEKRYKKEVEAGRRQDGKPHVSCG